MCIRSSVFSLLFVLPLPLMAAGERESPSSSAGVLEKQIQREFRFEELPPNKEIPVLEIDIPEQTLQVPEGISVFIQEIKVEGNSIMDPLLLQTIVDAYINKEISGADVRKLCGEIDQLYADRGYILAWTYPPAQKIQGGILRLRILEGFIEKIEVEGGKHYKPSFVHSYFSHLESNPFNYYDILRSMLLLNENMNLSAKAVVRKGDRVGGVIFVVQIHDTVPFQVSGGYNNWGSTSTTYNQMVSEIDAANLVCSGDSLAFMTSFGMPPVFYYFNPVYSIPLNRSGSSLELSYLYSFSNIQSPTPWKLTGWSEIGTISFSQALSRTRRFDSNIYASFEIEQVKNLVENMTISYDKLRIISIGGSIDYIDTVQGRNFVDGYLHVGVPDILGGSKAVDPLCSRPGGGGRFWICNIDVQRLQPFWTDYLLVFLASGQGTFNELPITEQLALGGEGTVRGYASAIACGDSGYFANLEFHMPPPFLRHRTFMPMKKPWKEILNLLCFVDHGAVYTNGKVSGEASPAYLTSVGAGFRFYGPRNLTIGLDAAFPITSLYKQFSSFIYFRINLNLSNFR